MPQLPSGQFDPSQYNDMRDFTPVPPGKYIAKVISSEMRETSTGGEMLVLDSEISAGPYAGKTYVTRLNLVNANPTAVKIANEELATLTRACGLGPITNSEQLHGIAHVVDLKLIPAEGEYGPKNEPKGYSSAQGLTEPPLNPEPTPEVLAIINGMSGVPSSEASAAPASTGSVPQAPAGFAPPPPPPTDD